MTRPFPSSMRRPKGATSITARPPAVGTVSGASAAHAAVPSVAARSSTSKRLTGSPYASHPRKVKENMRAGSRVEPELAADDVLLDLARALPDRPHLGIAEVALDGKLLDVAVAAVDLHRVPGDLDRGLGREELRLAHQARAALARVVRLAGALEERAGSVQPGRHAGDLEARRLVVADRLAEGDPLLHVRERRLVGSLGDAEAERGDVEPVQ